MKGPGFYFFVRFSQVKKYYLIQFVCPCESANHDSEFDVSSREGWDGAELTQKWVDFAPPSPFHDPDGLNPELFKTEIRPRA